MESQTNRKYYVGSTTDIRRRLIEHLQGQSKYTKHLLPLRLVFLKKFETIREARRVEYKLKRLKRKDILRRIITEQRIYLGG